MIPKSGHEHQLDSENTNRGLDEVRSGCAHPQAQGLWTLIEGTTVGLGRCRSPHSQRAFCLMFSARVARVGRRSLERVKTHQDHQVQRR